MSAQAQSPTFARCCGAIVGLATGTVRPRRPDQRFLRSLHDAGLPSPRGTVEISPLRQRPRRVPTAFIVEGSHRPRHIENTLASFVITHREATFIVDPGVSTDVGARVISQLPAVLRMAVRPGDDVVPTVEALADHPGLAESLDFALPTHAHWDHVCGLLDLPDLPVHLHRDERNWIMSGQTAPVGGVRDSLVGRPVVDYELDGPPVLTFTRSHDLFGDGTVTLVDLAGHTPGSVGVLAHTAHGWILLAGDAAWHTRQVDELRQKSSYPGGLADEDRDEAFRTLHRLHAVKDHVTVVPTHDPRTAHSTLPCATQVT